MVFRVLAHTASLSLLLVTCWSVLALPVDVDTLEHSKDFVLVPSKVEPLLPAVGVMLVQGTELAPETYAPLLKALQSAAAAEFNVWCVVPAFTGNIPDPATSNAVLSRGRKALQDAGLPSGAPIVAMGHSLGGVVAQDIVVKEEGGAEMLVLMGAGLQRKWRHGKNNNGTFPVPTLTLDGTLDGVFRVTRQAEGFYHQILNPRNASEAQNFPIIVYEGVSHMQFSSGPPTALLKKRDLKPEVDADHAHQMMGSSIAAFMSVQLRGSQAVAHALQLSAEVNATSTIMRPIIAALELEANPHLKQACDTDHPMPQCPPYPRYPSNQKSEIPEVDCVCGTPWSAIAQATMAGLPSDVTIVSADGIHNVDEVTPVHLPFLWSNCSSPLGCTLNVTTVTQSVYSDLDGFDTGFYPESALELRTKMKSRQAMWIGSGNVTADFAYTDVSSSLCKEINQLALDWAADHASDAAKQRFQRIGEPIVVGEDKGPYNVGPLWIWDDIDYDTVKSRSGASEVRVEAPMMRTPVDYKVELAAGFHYCKLLSPARALEWMMIDGLRLRGSVGAGDHDTL